MAPRPSKMYPQYGCLFCSRSYAAINLLIKHQDRYLSEYCAVYHPGGTTQFHASSHPVEVLRYVRHAADRHPGASHGKIVWEEVVFRPWVAPVVTAVRLENAEEKKKHTVEFRYLTAEQWVGRLGEIVEVKKGKGGEVGELGEDEEDEGMGDEEDESDREDESDEEEEDDEEEEQEDEENLNEEDVEEADQSDLEETEDAEEASEVDQSDEEEEVDGDSNDDEEEDETDNENDDDTNEDGIAPDQAEPSPSPSSSASSSVPGTPMNSPPRAMTRTSTTHGPVSSASASGALSNAVSTNAGPKSYVGRNATITLSPQRPKPRAPSTPVRPIPAGALTSAARAAQYYTPGNTMPVFVRLRIVLHPMAPAWILPVPAPYGLREAVALVKEGLQMRGVGGDGFPDLVGLVGRKGAIGDLEWDRIVQGGGMVDVELVWDV